MGGFGPAEIGVAGERLAVAGADCWSLFESFVFVHLSRSSLDKILSMENEHLGLAPACCRTGSAFFLLSILSAGSGLCVGGLSRTGDGIWACKANAAMGIGGPEVMVAVENWGKAGRAWALGKEPAAAK